MPGLPPIVGIRAVASGSMTRLPPLRRAAITTVVVLLALVDIGACSSKKADTVSAGEAAGMVSDVFTLPADQRSCLEQHFADSAAARQVLNSGDVASAGDLRAFGEVEAACIPPETLAASITNSANDSFGGTLTDAQKACLSDGVAALDEADRKKLLVGLVVSNSGAMDVAGIAELGQVTNGLLNLCRLDIATTQTQPAPDDTTPVG